MATDRNVAPIIVKRKKVVVEGGHHGGAWKVAYADFVTAMMAFFMLMWLLNATTEKQRKGLADYFSPTIAISRVSAGGDGALAGHSVFSEDVLPQVGTGASHLKPTEAHQARGQLGDGSNSAAEGDANSRADANGNDPDALQFKAVESLLLGRGGESAVSDGDLQHIITKVTDVGMIVELSALPDRPLFDPKTGAPTPLLDRLAQLLVSVFKDVRNDIAIDAHMAAEPIVLREDPTWQASLTRVDQMRNLLINKGETASRIQRITGHGAQKPVSYDPMAPQNNRIEVTLLRH